MTASDINSDSHAEVKPSADALVRRLASRYLFVLVAVALLVVVDQAIIQPLLVRLNAYAPAINLAGRQRMLSQKLTKAALALQLASDDAKRRWRHDELRETLRQWAVAHDALREGNRQLGIQRIHSAEIDRQWKLIEPHFRAMCVAARRIVDMPDVDEADPATFEAVSHIVAHEVDFLPVMDKIVKLMELEAAREVFRLRAYALTISVAVVTLLVGLGWFVVRPASRTIREQVDELESRVARRTSELSLALASLQREIHERQQAETKTRRLASQLAHAERVSTMGHLAVGLAHELNQPLAAISNYAEACDVLLAEDAADRGQVRAHLEGVRKAALRAGQIVRRIRNFVRPNLGTTTNVEIEINGLIQEIVALCRIEAEHSGVEVRLHLTKQDSVVWGDPIQLQQVLVNLVHNALQAMQECSIAERRLEIHTTACDGMVQVDVSDSGPGFPSLDPDAMFAPFHTTKSDGLGMGLAICRSIVDDHRGTIRASSSGQPRKTK